MIIKTKEEFAAFVAEYWRNRHKPSYFSIGICGESGEIVKHRNITGESMGSLAVMMDAMGTEPSEGIFEFSMVDAAVMLEYFTPYLDEKIDKDNHANIHAIREVLREMLNNHRAMGFVEIVVADECL